MKTLQILHRLFMPILLVLGLSLLGACADQPTGTGPAGPNSTISGVLNDEGGYIVPGATVEAVGNADARIASDVTTEQGTFELKGLPENLSGVRLRVMHSDFRPYASSIQDVVTNAGGATTGVLVSVLHADSCCATLTVHVTGPNGQALSGVEVKLRKGDKLITVGTTNDDGNVVFTNVCDGEFNLRVAKEGYQVIERGGIRVVRCEPVRAEFGMVLKDKEKEKKADSCCKGFLRIVPKDSATGAVLTGGKVIVKKQGTNTRSQAVGGDGAIFREMCEGTYVINVMKEGYKGIEFTVTMRCNDSQVVDNRRLSKETKPGEGDSCCNGRLKVMLRDSTTNAAVNGAHVIVRKGDKTIGDKETAEGIAVFEKLCKGVYTIVIEKTGYVRVEKTIEIGCNEQKVLELKLKATGDAGQDTCCNGRLTIGVKDSTTNAAIANVTVKLWKAGTLIAMKTTSANGVVTFEKLCTGSYGVVLIREGYTSREFSVSIACNQNVEASRKLLATGGNNDSCCNAVFKYRTKDSAVADGGWQSGVTVTIKQNDVVIATGTTNADGNYGREAICGYKTYVVTFSKEGFKTKSVTVVLTTCRTVQETILLSRQ